MDVKFYSDVVNFSELCYSFLAKHEAKNNLLFGILNTLKRNIHAYGSLERPRLITITKDEEIKLISIRTPPYNQLLSYTDDLESISVLVDTLSTKEENIPGVLGFKEGAWKFARAWASEHKKSVVLNMHERIYQLKSINPQTLGDNTFEEAKQSHTKVLIEWMKEFIIEAMPHKSQEDIINSQRRMKEAITRGEVFILRVNDQIVSMAKKAGSTPNGRTINAVYTPPSFRRRGYATEVVAKLCQNILDEGKKYCYLFTNLANPTSNSIYMQIGFKPVIDVDELLFQDQINDNNQS
ncbi:MAG: GNAT family N-acetyltransferase [Candidatus Heimdallarchaeota archaeon]|nr:MAG: GNAT family N-acetyltransferase [Candidatus Heimdallarchaeota archaeon]